MRPYHIGVNPIRVDGKDVADADLQLLACVGLAQDALPRSAMRFVLLQCGNLDASGFCAKLRLGNRPMAADD